MPTKLVGYISKGGVMMAGGQKIRCKRCNEVIQSMHRDDMKWCSCGLIYIDGGSDYTRIGFGGQGQSAEECYDYVDDNGGVSVISPLPPTKHPSILVSDKRYTKEQIEAAIRYAVNSAQGKIESQKAGIWYMLDATAFWNYLRDI
jgi:hypothetical protein